VDDLATPRASLSSRTGSDPRISGFRLSRPSDLRALHTRISLSISWRWATTLISAGVISAGVFAMVDATRRSTWHTFSASAHWTAVIALYALAGATGGLLTWALHTAERRVIKRLAARWPKRRRALRILSYSFLFALWTTSTAYFAFSGDRIGQTPWRYVGPPILILLFMSCAAIVAHLAMAAFAAVDNGRLLLATLIGAGFAGAAAACILADLHLFVALYDPLHSLLEFCAALLIGIVAALALWAVARRVEAGGAVGVVGSAAIAWAVIPFMSVGARTWIDASLRHVWLEEVYAGRMLRRMQMAEAFLSNPFDFQGLEMARVERLKQRFRLTQTTLGPKWQAPLREPQPFAEKIQTLRGGHRDYDIILYYVDTLRHDTAMNPKVMPNVVKFAESSLNFRRAYATGSDTLRSLPGLTGGNYDVDAQHPNDILDVARRTQHESVLVIAKSAQEFLAKMRPTFRFERTLSIEDYPKQREVWGYGADQPTAAPVVDAALEYLEQHRDRRAFMWLFNFDVHNWRELTDEYVNANVDRYGVQKEGDPAWRYHTVARAVDGEFGRLLAGLELQGRLDRAVIVFVSDHGEALGRDGFWVHSVFLWESLIRVPLMIRVPALAPKTIEDIVSLVDVAPTLARYMDPEPDMAGYHGEDLIGYLVPDRPKRRLPLLLNSSSKDVLVRAGIIDPVGKKKLVLSFEAALPELYEIDSADPDTKNLAESQRTRTRVMLGELVRSPVFPRSLDDFDLNQATPRGITPRGH
jgi:hypothetical protein